MQFQQNELTKQNEPTKRKRKGTKRGKRTSKLTKSKLTKRDESEILEDPEDPSFKSVIPPTSITLLPNTGKSDESEILEDPSPSVFPPTSLLPHVSLDNSSVRLENDAFKNKVTSLENSLQLSNEILKKREDEISKLQVHYADLFTSTETSLETRSNELSDTRRDLEKIAALAKSRKEAAQAASAELSSQNAELSMVKENLANRDDEIWDLQKRHASGVKELIEKRHALELSHDDELKRLRSERELSDTRRDAELSVVKEKLANQDAEIVN